MPPRDGGLFAPGQRETRELPSRGERLGQSLGPSRATVAHTWDNTLVAQEAPTPPTACAIGCKAYKTTGRADEPRRRGRNHMHYKQLCVRRSRGRGQTTTPLDMAMYQTPCKKAKYFTWLRYRRCGTLCTPGAGVELGAKTKAWLTPTGEGDLYGNVKREDAKDAQ